MAVIGKLQAWIEINTKKQEKLRRSKILNKSNTSSPRKLFTDEVRLEAIQYFAKLLEVNSVKTVKSKPFLEALVVVQVSCKQSFNLVFVIKY